MTETRNSGGDVQLPDEREIFTVSYAADLDREQVKENIDEMHPDADYVNVRDRTTGRDVALRGTRPQIVCPKCGEEAYGLRSSGGERVYSHSGDDNCTVRDDDWEPPRGHPEEDVSVTVRLKRAVPHAVSLSLTLAIGWVLLEILPSFNMTVNGETATVDPGSVALPALAILALVTLFTFAIPYLPGTAGGRARR